MTNRDPSLSLFVHCSASHCRGARRLRAAQHLHRLIIALIFVGVFTAGVGADRVVVNGGDQAGASSSLTDLKEFSVLQETWNLAHDKYVAPDSVTDRQLIYGASSGMLAALGDTGHTRFLDPEEAKVFEDATRGEFIGVGVELDTQDGLPLVIAPIDGSPADQAGIRSGDVILEVNGQSTDGMSLEELGKQVRGDEGTQVALALRHAGEDTSYTVKLIRRKITLHPVSWSMLPNHVAFIRLSEFSSGTSDALKKAVEQAKAKGATSIILDLRNNPGGLVTEAIGTANQFLPEGTTIFQEQGRDGKAKPIKSFGRGIASEWPVAVLVNRGSASAAEIVAGALKDNDRAQLIGERTYGTGTVLLPYELDDGSVALIGTSLWLTAGGQAIWKKGIEPNHTVAQALDVPRLRPSDDPDVTSEEFAALQDNQLRVAYDELGKQPATAATPRSVTLRA